MVVQKLTPQLRWDLLRIRRCLQFTLKELEDDLAHLESVEEELSTLAQQPWPEPKEMPGGLLVYNPKKYAMKWRYSAPTNVAQGDVMHPHLTRKKKSVTAYGAAPQRSSPGVVMNKERKNVKKNTVLETFQKIFEQLQEIMSKVCYGRNLLSKGRSCEVSNIMHVHLPTNCRV